MSIPALTPPVGDPDLSRLIAKLEAIRGSWYEDLVKLDRYRKGKQDITYMSEAMRKEFGDSITDLVLNFPELVVDAHNDRLDVEGFRFPGEPSGNDDLWGIWQANGMDGKSVMAHDDSLALSKAAVIVGAGAASGDAPVITVESAFDCAWIRSPSSGSVTSAIKRWTEDDSSQWASVYTPGRTRRNEAPP